MLHCQGRTERSPVDTERDQRIIPLGPWKHCLAELDYEVTCKPRLKHQCADALSRILTNGGDQSSLENEIPTIWDEQ